MLRSRINLFHMELVSNKYDVLVEMGRVGGGFNAGIAIVRRRSDRLICVRKRLVLGQLSTPRHWNREAALMRKLRGHRNICGIIEADIGPEKGELYLEYCKMGTLHDFIKYMKGTNLAVPEPFVWHVLTIYPTVKLGDFGLAINKEDINNLSSTSRAVCAPGWFPPEYPLCGERSDVYRTAAIAQLLCLPHWALGIGAQISSPYSSELATCIRTGMSGNIHERPFALEFARFIDSRTPCLAQIPVPSGAFRVREL
ncbi:serine/threonine protein kinase [Blastomyces dermatitidis ER-3]|uniref:Serine/threonine protein kinase n=1 Tax=Ajellomyces dermatitidis (strain ER-3 / ATCC MYA-2586) TaxID=559297 RepID=A0ABP2ESW5_AJEDR|nr:serine/threonine protein kinase [Blastomyces dermatitidis ER-3]EEQ84684.2 serine/threonine protein kinase [Blastomyces dermatitidis ER-3]